jgi:hypothetical protein
MKFYFFVFTLLFILSLVSAECVDLFDLEYHESYSGHPTYFDGGINYTIINESIKLCQREYDFNKKVMYVDTDNVVIDCNGAILKGDNLCILMYGEPNKKILNNVTIKNCLFEGCRVRGSLPTHFRTPLTRLKDFGFSDLNIINNTFSNTSFILNHFKNSKIKNNRFVSSSIWMGRTKNMTFTLNKYIDYEEDSSFSFGQIEKSEFSNNVMIFRYFLIQYITETNFKNNYFRFNSFELTSLCPPNQNSLFFNNNFVLNAEIWAREFRESDFENNIYVNSTYHASFERSMLGYPFC